MNENDQDQLADCHDNHNAWSTGGTRIKHTALSTYQMRNK